VKSADGESMSIGYRLSPLTLPTQEAVGYAMSFGDVTRVQRLRREHDRLLQIASIHQLLPTVLHELRNPLAAITNALELLIEDYTDPNLQEELHAVLSEARRMRLSIEGIGTVGRDLRSERLQAVDFACREAFRVMAARARSAGVLAEMHVADLPLLPFDVAMVRAIVFNLVNNAIQACKEGERIDLIVKLDERREVLEITVTDTGCGMGEEVMQRCSEMFYTTKPRGSGIGVPLCRGAAEGAGGVMHIESAKGAGTCITLRIPIDPSHVLKGASDGGASIEARAAQVAN